MRGVDQMGLLDNLKNINVGKLADQLGLDDKVADVLENLVDQLEELAKDGKLDDLAQSALTAFKPALARFKKSDELDALLDKAKPFLEKLSKADLPGDLENLVGKAAKLLK